MAVNRGRQLVPYRAVASVFLALIAIAGAPPSGAQAGNPTSRSNPFFGSVTVEPASGELLRLSLDDAIRRGLENNLGLRQAEYAQKLLEGEKKEALQEFLPTVTLTGDSGYYEHNLAALGFSPSVASQFTSRFPGASFPLITNDYLTQGQLHFEQTLFSGPVIAGWKAAGAAERVAYYSRMSAEGEVIQQVAVAYLRAIAAASDVDNARALMAEDQLALEQAREAHQAGTVANLDVLRAQVEFQAQQQAVIAAENNLDKDLILLKRETGIAPGQKIDLTDRTPYSELAAQSAGEVLAIAYKNRQDYQNLQNQVIEDKALRAAYRSQRLPSLSFKGFYGVSTVNGAGTHGNFAFFGTLSLPVFREARLRGDVDAAQAELNAANAQLDDLREKIDQQVHDALMDVTTSDRLVEVARSNLDMARQELSDETDRVHAGVDNNLPLVTAQATLAAAQNNLVESLYHFNVAKLGLARAAGIIQTQYRAYLGN